MGTEIVFVLIYPVALGCLLVAVWRWFGLAKIEPTREIGIASLFLPLIAGFVVSMMGLALLTYVYCYADFTSLVSLGYYTEAERPVYLPGRVVGQAVVELVFVLPAICLIVIPLTTRLIRNRRLTWSSIGLRAIAGWIVLLLLGSLMSPESLLALLTDTVPPVLIYGMPIPIAALLLLPNNRERDGEVSSRVYEHTVADPS
ncbi:hypothetical protein [Sphingomonas sp.]|uniref:hypothetical protein n=1 Tax=Sphingomonas sp. TaxID=28214 RepID=UPI0025DB85F6|nr:hypothetical protein [Sphingomonas sp.]MBV9529313.1 hypothetical protein [Sphingomonas sp.]